ncbi:MAG: NgoPII family restriction endonuclease [Candidatus Micrarchaeia archaeon]|jgi:hypothetical protein
MTGVLSAIANIAAYGNFDLTEYKEKSKIRANAMGDILEEYCKDALAGAFGMNAIEKAEKHSEIFSYLGNQNNPPDAIIKGSDAFEFKKIEGFDNGLALNSSYPKDCLLATDQRISGQCKTCEEWKVKDLFYAVGSIHEKKLNYLLFTQGNCYAASKEVYRKVEQELKAGIGSLISSKGLDGGVTTELGRVHKVDPLGITELRVRGMWQIQNPVSLFGDQLGIKKGGAFTCSVIMLEEKYRSYDDAERKKIENIKGMTIKNIKIKDPNNPARLLDAKAITWKKS